MKEVDNYREQITKMVYGIDDAVFLRRLYKLINIIIKIDDEWILTQFDRFVDNIQR